MTLMLRELRRLFLVGLFTLAPLALTVWIIIKTFQWMDSLFQPTFIAHYIGFNFPGLGILLGVAAIVLFGIIAPSILGKQFLFLTERVVEKLPLVKLIYSGTKQIFDSFSKSSSEKFRRVVYVEFPHKNSYSIGFVTQDRPDGWIDGHSDYRLAVFVPTTPNPTSGYLLFLRDEDTIPLNISVEEALKLVISGGLVRPTENSIKTQ